MRLKPRDYQREAAEWALRRRRAVIQMPTGSGKTLIAVMWIRGLRERGKARRFLVLEPTRFLVEQNARFMRSQGLDASPVHGSLPKSLRESGWRSEVVVATPEVVVADWEKFSSQGFDAVVVDECHHTTGQDAYRRVISEASFEYSLGLTAYVPPSRRREIERLLGEIREWGWDDPRISRYLPEWEAEVYEAPLNPAEERLYSRLEDLWERVRGSDRALVGNAIRWFVRDGAAALRESVERGGRLRELIPSGVVELLFSREVRPAHKLETLRRVLADHEGFEKSIVFVERVGVAELIHEEMADYNPVLILGRRRIDPKEALRRARLRESRLLVSTSAGEEGIDLPAADLLVVWSNVASPLRFIQRLGRVLRAATGQRWRPRWVVYVVTPDTVDVDSLLDGLMEARRAGVTLNVDPSVVEYLWSLSRRRRYLELLEVPMPPDVLARASGAPEERVREALRWLGERGLVVYIHTPMGRIYSSRGAIDRLREEYGRYLRPDPGAEGKVIAYLGDESVSARGDVERVCRRLLPRLRSWGRFDRLRASIRVREDGLERLVNLSYSFRIEDPQVLRLVLDNAFCREALGVLG